MPTRPLRLRSVVSCLGASLLPASARAADLPADDTHVLPCRPTIACTADIVAPGVFELETGALYRHLGSPGPVWTFPFLAKLTLAKWIQVQAGSNGFTQAIDPGVAQYLDDLTVTAKFHLTDADPHGATPSVSASAGFSFPASTNQEGFAPTYDATFTAYASKDFGPIHADANLALELWRIDASATAQELATLALSLALPPPFGVMAEAYYFSPADPVATRDGGILFAVSHSPRPWLTFDAGGDVGYFPSTRSFSVFVGMTIAPVVFWK